MDDLTISWAAIAPILSAIILIGGAGAYIFKIFKVFDKPRKELEERNLKLEKRMQEQEEKLSRVEMTLRNYIDDKILEDKVVIEKMSDELSVLKEDLKDSRAENTLILHSLFAIGNHIVSNDSADKIKDINKSILSYLIKNRTNNN